MTWRSSTNQHRSRIRFGTGGGASNTALSLKRPRAYTKLFSRLAMTLVLGTTSLAPGVLFAQADTLTRGDVSLGLYQTFAPFNRYWYHYNGTTDCAGTPCTRLNLNSYDVLEVPLIGNQEATMENSLLATTGFRIEYGVFDRLTLHAETQLAYTSPLEPKLSLGDSRLGFRWRATTEGPLVLSLAPTIKLPGTYSPYSLAAPGGGQPDVELKALVGGLAFHRRLIYDVGFGYRIRLPYPNTEIVTLRYTEASDPDGMVAGEWAVIGPPDEVFLDFAAGVYVSRKVFVFLNGNLVNSVKGVNVDDYYLTVARLSETDEDGENYYELERGDPEHLLAVMEEDFLRVGAGVMFKFFYSTTFYLNYSLSILGQNSPAFFVPEGSNFPIGAVLGGIEYTFGTRGPSHSQTASARDRTFHHSVLTSSLPSLSGS